jgi:hypothetical protein
MGSRARCGALRKHLRPRRQGLLCSVEATYNIASWNLNRRPVSIGTDGNIRVAGRLIRFFHFTKLNWVGELMLELYTRDQVEVFELVHWYRRRLADHASGEPARWVLGL